MTESNDPARMRIGDPERTEALDRLGSHFANGYLTPAEYEERTGHVVAARTRGELDRLFTDLPAVSETGGVNGKALASKDAALDELEHKLEQKNKLDNALGVLWAITLALFFVGFFVLDLTLFWVVFPVAGVLTAGLYGVYGITDEEEEVLEKIQKDANEQRAERLRIAHERRKELGR